jgi:peptide/nickel transport system substrate-binding protein
MKRVATLAAVCATAVALAACSGSSNGGSGNKGKKTGGKLVDGATFTLGMSADPGNLDPQLSAASNLYQLSYLAYDSLVNVDLKNQIQSGLASSWKATGKSVQLTIKKGITCSDGSPFTAEDVAKNVTFIADPENKSPFLGVFLPAGSKATADAAANTVTITYPGNSPFVLFGLAGVPLVCAKGLQDRKSLAHATDGTGPYQLTEAVSGDHLTYTKRAGYTWGPNGASTATKGMPAKIVVKIVQNETTAANLVLSGGLTATSIYGADAQRLSQAGLFEAHTTSVLGEMWFNHAKGRPGAEPEVRKAMTQALDLPQLQKVLTSGRGAEPTVLAANEPVACPGNSAKGAVPAHDVEAAKQLLDGAGWKAGAGGVRSKGGKQLTMTLLYNTAQGAGASAAAELAAQMWKAVGVKTVLKAQDETQAVQTLFSTGDWDVAWEPVNVGVPDQLVPFLSGPAVPNGNNFAHIDNAAYTASVAKAAKIQGTAGCSEWLHAESELFKAADVVPFANQIVKTFAKNAQFTIVGLVVPTSIRMLAS